MVIAVCCLGMLAAAATGLHFSGSLGGQSKAKSSQALNGNTPAARPGFSINGGSQPATMSNVGAGDPPTTSQGIPAEPASFDQSADAPPTTLSQTQPTPAPVLNQAPPSQAPALNQTPVGMPDDIRKYLQFLAEIERQRQSLANSELASAITLMANLQSQDISAGLDPNDEDSQAKADQRTRDRSNGYANSADGMRSQWQQLTSKFLAVAPPSACGNIQKSYSTTLTATGGMILEITNAVRSAAADPQHALQILTSLKGTSNSRVDAPAKETDQEVAAICAKYNTPKWFEIKADIGGGLMSQIGL